MKMSPGAGPRAGAVTRPVMVPCVRPDGLWVGMRGAKPPIRRYVVGGRPTLLVNLVLNVPTPL